MAERKPDIFRTISLERLWAILDDEYLYSLLPGDGQDDYILSWLKQRIVEEAKREALPSRERSRAK
jgi:hypothetical protein